MVEFEEVAAGVFSVGHDFVEGKNAVVFGDDGALAIDGGNYVEDGEAMAAFMRERGSETGRLALTHGHGDHVLGAAPLAKGEVFAHDRTPAVMERQVAGWAQSWEVSEAEARTRLPWPTATFSDELLVHLGGRTVRLLPTPGHSEDGVSALVPEEGVLIGGDAVVTGIVPAIGAGNSRDLEASLHTLLRLDIGVLVPGHGPVVYGRDEVRGWLEWEAEYLASVRARVQELVEGDGTAAANLDAVLDAVDYDTFVGSRWPVERHNMPKRHRNTVQKIVEEETTRDC